MAPTAYLQLVLRERDEPSTPLTHRFYVMVARDNYVALSDSMERVIESLWLGFIEEYPFDFKGAPASLGLHPSQLRDDRPLPIVRQGDEYMAVVRRCESRTHSFLCKHDPQLAGHRSRTSSCGGTT